MFARIVLLPFLLIVISFSACRNKAVKQAEPVILQGRYINQTFLEKSAESLDFSSPGYCFQLVFGDGKKVFVDRGFEGDSLSVAYENGKIRLLNATSTGDLPILPDTDGKGFMLLDSSFTGKPYVSHFIRSEDTIDSVPALIRKLNEQMIAGSYVVYDKEKSLNKTVNFLSSGKVTGIPGFDTYVLCFTGDCMQTTQPYYNTITLSGAAGSTVTYAYKMEKGTGSLKLFSIEPPIPGTKGERKVKDLVYDLRKN
jgi:hypothetical protein